MAQLLPKVKVERFHHYTPTGTRAGSTTAHVRRRRCFPLASIMWLGVFVTISPHPRQTRRCAPFGENHLVVSRCGHRSLGSAYAGLGLTVTHLAIG